MEKTVAISKLKGFYKKAKDLRLVNSQEEFAKLLNYSRSQYHKLLSGEYPIQGETLDVAERLITGETKAVSRETLLLEALLKKQNTLIETQNTILADMKQNVQDRVKNIETNLQVVRGQAEGIELYLVSGQTVILQSLSRLEGKKENFLLTQADNKKVVLAEAKNARYKNKTGGSAHTITEQR